MRNKRLKLGVMLSTLALGMAGMSSKVEAYSFTTYDEVIEKFDELITKYPMHKEQLHDFRVQFDTGTMSPALMLRALWAFPADVQNDIVALTSGMDQTLADIMQLAKAHNKKQTI